MRTETIRHDVELPVRQPFDAPGIFRFLAVRAVHGVEAADLTVPGQLRYARTLMLPHGPGAVEVTAAAAPGGEWRLLVRLELAADADAGPALSRVRSLFDVDADPATINAALAADPALAPLVERTPGIRVPGAVDPHELVMRALVGQQISVAAARTHLSRLAAAAGIPYTSAVCGLDRLFPAPADIVDCVPEPVPGETLDPGRPLRLPGQAIRAVRAAAGDLASGVLEVGVGADPDVMREQLLSRPRIGPWTAAYIAMRVLGDSDAWLAGDVALIAGAKAAGVLEHGTDKAAAHRILASRAMDWAPWRSYAAMHLWQAAAVGGNTWPCRGTVVLSLPAEAVLPFAGDGSVEAMGPDCCRLTAGSWSWEALAASLGRFGADVEVEDPPELAEAFGRLAARFAAAAAGKSLPPAQDP